MADCLWYKIHQEVSQALRATMGAIVQETRHIAVPTSELPVIVVFPELEEPDADPTFTQPPGLQSYRVLKKFSLKITAVHESLANLSRLSYEIQVKMDSLVLGERKMLVGVSISEEGKDAERPYFAADFDYEIWYATSSSDPSQKG